MKSFQPQYSLVEQLKAFVERPHSSFYTPGHKGGRGTSEAIAQLLGQKAFIADLPELPGLDNLFAPEGVILIAQELAAQTFGADQTWFLVNGSTCGLEAAILAICSPGDKVIVPRNLHQSVVSALILSGVTPVFISPEADVHLGIAHGVSTETVQIALQKHSDAKAILLTYPTYYGVGCDLEAIAALAHDHNIPLLVDEAHGAHFAFHSELPPSALAQGADLTVQSTHKTLSALTQASMLHIRGDRIQPQRINRALQMLQSSSPSYLLLASLDGARAQIGGAGQQLMEYALSLASDARDALTSISGVGVFDLNAPVTSAAKFLDQTRLTVDVRGLGITGYEADEILHEELAITAELPGLNTLTFIISFGNTTRDIEQLIHAFNVLVERFGTKKTVELIYGDPIYSNSGIVPRPAFDLLNSPSVSIPVQSPRDAYFAEAESVAIAQSVGRISTEIICPYPPGIPALLPGERITAEVIEMLQHIKASGGVITGCADSTLETLTVAC